MHADALPGWDEATRPRIEPYEATPAEHAQGDHLRMVHDAYRQGFVQVAATLAAAAAGTADAGDVRAAVHGTGLQAAYQRAGNFCGQLCTAIGTHHRIEDAFLYPALQAADPARMGEVLGRLSDEHDIVHAVLERLDAEAVALAADPSSITAVTAVFEHLRGLMESHFRYEEEQIGDALGVHRVMV